MTRATSPTGWSQGSTSSSAPAWSSSIASAAAATAEAALRAAGSHTIAAGVTLRRPSWSSTRARCSTSHTTTGASGVANCARHTVSWKGLSPVGQRPELLGSSLHGRLPRPRPRPVGEHDGDHGCQFVGDHVALRGGREGRLPDPERPHGFPDDAIPRVRRPTRDFVRVRLRDSGHRPRHRRRAPQGRAARSAGQPRRHRGWPRSARTGTAEGPTGRGQGHGPRCPRCPR